MPSESGHGRFMLSSNWPTISYRWCPKYSRRDQLIPGPKRRLHDACDLRPHVVEYPRDAIFRDLERPQPLVQIARRFVAACAATRLKVHGNSSSRTTNVVAVRVAPIRSRTGERKRKSM